MAISVIIHINDEDPIAGELEQLPATTDQTILVMNPRRVDGKDLHYLAAGVVNVIWPIARVAFIEIMPTDQEDEIIGFVRE